MLCCVERARELLVRRAHRRKLQILANSVEREVGYVRIRESVFELFAGGLVEARASKDLEFKAVSRQIRSNPVFSEGLLRLGPS